MNKAKIKKLIFLFLLGIISFIFTNSKSLEAAPKYKPLTPFSDEEKYIITIMPFSYESELEQYSDMVNKIPSKLLSELYTTKRFRIIERSRLDTVMKEMQLGQTGVLDEESAVKVGKQLGAELIILGSVTSIKTKESKKTLGFASMQTVEVTVDLDVRLIKLETGEIVGIAKATGEEVQKKKMAFGAKAGSIESPETMINIAIDKAVKDIAYSLASEISPKKVK